jgi:hypothetical protein
VRIPLRLRRRARSSLSRLARRPLPQHSGSCLRSRVDGSDQPDASRKSHVKLERGAKAVDLVESDTVGVTTNRPNQDDVTGKSASGVGSEGDIDRSYLPTVDPQQAEGTNPSARIPGWAIDDLRVVSKRSRRGHDDEVLIVRFARTNHPAAPRLCANRRTDDVELTSTDASGRGQPFRHLRWTRNRVANFIGSGLTVRAKLGRRLYEERRRWLWRPGGQRDLGAVGAAATQQRRERHGGNQSPHFSFTPALVSEVRLSPPSPSARAAERRRRGGAASTGRYREPLAHVSSTSRSPREQVSR